MRILIGCECSGRVRDAFIKRGHDAISCDIKPSEAPGPHIHGDVRDAIKGGGLGCRYIFPRLHFRLFFWPSLELPYRGQGG